MNLQADGFGQCYQQCLEECTDAQPEQLFELLGLDLPKVVGALGCCHTKQQLSHACHMPQAGSVASSSQGLGPPGLPIQNAHQIAIDELPHQQLQGSERQVLELQSQMDQVRVQMAQFQLK